jgi:dUTP pyrophosphatase
VTDFIHLQIFTPDVVVVQELEETVRGAGGFGSTGGFGGALPGIGGLPQA